MKLNLASKKGKCISCLTLFFVSINMFSVYFDSSSGSVDIITLEDRSHPLEVQILLWVNPKNPPRKTRLGLMNEIAQKMNFDGNNLCQAQFHKDKNNEFTCRFSVSSTNVSQADAVVFFMFNEGYRLPDFPQHARKLEKPWIMYTIEPPTLSKWKDTLSNIFNWTMTYRSDSDIWAPYGEILSKPNVSMPLLIQNQTLDKWIAGKSKFAAGVITNCRTPSKREKLISEMQKTGIGNIEIYGKCGKKNICGRYSHDCAQFWTNLAKEYKFYLAFENSLCNEYITEKFYRTLELGMIPVVYGGGNYKLVAPPESYIDATDFKSVNELMKYLKMLDENPEEYAKYFEWRQVYKIRTHEYYWATRDWCSLCKAVKDETLMYMGGNLNSKVYKNINWWHQNDPKTNKSACVSPDYKFPNSKWLK